MTGPAAAAMTVERSAVLMKRASYASVVVAAVLITAKLVAWLATGSVSVLSSLLDSLLDIAASLVNVFAIHQAVTPADREHRFGHGKAEPLAGLGQSAFIAGSAVFLSVEALHRMTDPVPVEHSRIGIAVMILSIVLSIFLVRYQRSVVGEHRLVRDRRRCSALPRRHHPQRQRHRLARPF